MEQPSADDVRKNSMVILSNAHAVYVETMRTQFGEKGLGALGEANRLHGIELGRNGIKEGGLRKGDLRSIYEFFVSAHPYFGFELELTKVTDSMLDMKVTSCPWIDTFKANNVGPDICYWVTKMDEGIGQAVDPELQMTIPKCMMRGDDYCIYLWEK